jgi:hypothetical protein
VCLVRIAGDPGRPRVTRCEPGWVWSAEPLHSSVVKERLIEAGLVLAWVHAFACSSEGNGTNVTDGGAAGSGASTTMSGGGRTGAGASTSVDDPPKTFGTGGPVRDAGCERQVDLSVLTLGEPPPFDVVIVADHSDSLSWSRADLAAGLADLLTNVRGRAVRFFLMTPTQYGDSSAAALEPISGDPMVDWQDPATGKGYPDPVTEYKQTCADASGKVIVCPDPVKATEDYAAHGVWELRTGEPIAVTSKDMTDAQVQAEAARIRQAILDLPQGGSPHEAPLCTIGRYLSQPETRLPDHAVILVISDEDDTSTVKDCVATFEGGIKTETIDLRRPCSQNCDLTRFMMTGPSTNYRLEGTCVFANDRGELDRSLTQKVNASTGESSCTPGSPAVCTPEHRTILGNNCLPSYVVDTCNAVCSHRQEAYQCFLEFPASGANLCTQPFDYGGKHYANFPEYCNTERTSPAPWQGCHSEGIAVEPFVSRHAYSNTTTVMPGYATSEMVAYAKKKADAVFGQGAYLFGVIGFTPGASCVPKAGQSHASNLAGLLRNADHVFPICEPYGPALGSISAFGESLVQTVFQVPVSGGERVESVLVTGADGKERRLSVSDYTHDRATGRLTVGMGVLTAQDRSLRVEVVDPCVPIIR